LAAIFRLPRVFFLSKKLILKNVKKIAFKAPHTLIYKAEVKF